MQSDACMTQATFRLDSRLATDTAFVCEWPLCTVLLMNDSRYPWLIVVPRVMDVSEAFDLDPDRRATLWDEVSHAAAALKRLTQCRKINIGALGNVVAQLHVHVVARNVGDFAGNGPVWGQGAAIPYTDAARSALLRDLRAALAPPTR
jgi:diadenosine tetraphosphate (Ap4A) HIT family hydrolase